MCKRLVGPNIAIFAIFLYIWPPNSIEVIQISWNFHQTWQTMCCKTYPRAKLIALFLIPQGFSKEQILWIFLTLLANFKHILSPNSLTKSHKMVWTGIVVDIYKIYILRNFSKIGFIVAEIYIKNHESVFLTL